MAINIIQTPYDGAVVLDANNTNIKVQSTNGSGYYFRASININSVFFDEISLSRVDDFTAVFDLKKLYQAYFSPVFNPDFENILAVQTHLLREVSITIKEYSLATGILTQTRFIPSFFIMFNVKPVTFDCTAPVAFLGMESPVMLLPKDGKIAFPFYLGPTATVAEIKLTASDASVIDIQTLNLVKGGVVYLYQYDLAPENLAYTITHITATVKVNGTETITQRYRILRLPDYAVKEMAFQNNFGFYIPAYFDGQLTIENEFAQETDLLNDETQRISEINEDATYTLHTGTLRFSERGIVNMVAQSHDVRLKIDGEWYTVVNAVKKETQYRDKLHQYGESLAFTLRKGGDVENVNYVSVGDPGPSIEITSLTETSSNHFTINYRLNNGFFPATGYLKLYAKINSGNFLLRTAFIPTAPTGVLYYNFSSLFDFSFDFQFYLEEDGNPTNVSNIVTN